MGSVGIPRGPVPPPCSSQPPHPPPQVAIHSSPRPLLSSPSPPVPVHTRQTFQKQAGPAGPWLRVLPLSQERLQDLWDVYQRLGLEDDIVDPSNTLLREGPVLKISFRRSDPMERYLFLV